MRDDLLQAFFEADERGDWEAVLRLAREILSAEPDHPEARAYLLVAERRLQGATASRPAPASGDFVGRVEEMGRLLERSAGAAPPEKLVATVHAHTEGNPLFVNEVIRLLEEEGQLAPSELERHAAWSPRMPERVHEVIGRRLDRLSHECNRLLATAAVVGREFGADVVARLVERMGEAEVTAALEGALTAQLVEEVPGTLGRYRFAHKLVQETLEAELNTSQRVRLHAGVVEALEGLYGDRAEEHAAELAGHCAEAHLVMGTEKLVRYSLAAGRRALAVGAYEESYAILRRAVDAKGEETVDGELADLYGGMVWAQHLTERFEEGLAVQERLFEHCLTTNDVPGLISAAIMTFHFLHFYPGRARSTIPEVAGRALRVVEAAPPADSPGLVSVADLLVYADADEREVRAALERALRPKLQRGAATADAEVVRNCASVAFAANLIDLAVEYYERWVELAGANEPVLWRWVRHSDMSDILLLRGTRKEHAGTAWSSSVTWNPWGVPSCRLAGRRTSRTWSRPSGGGRLRAKPTTVAWPSWSDGRVSAWRPAGCSAGVPSSSTSSATSRQATLHWDACCPSFAMHVLRSS